MAVSRHLHACRNYAANYSVCRNAQLFSPGLIGKSSIQPSYIMLHRPKNEMEVIVQRSYKQPPQPQKTKSLNNSGGQGHLITMHLFGKDKLTKTARHLNLLGLAILPLISKLRARVCLRPKAKDLLDHCATGLEYSGPISEVVTLDDPAEVTLLYDDPFRVDFGWSSISLCLSGPAAGL
jgi:hypothetical protein